MSEVPPHRNRGALAAEFINQRRIAGITGLHHRPAALLRALAVVCNGIDIDTQERYAREEDHQEGAVERVLHPDDQQAGDVAFIRPLAARFQPQGNQFCQQGQGE